MRGRGVIEAAFSVLDALRELEPARLADVAEVTGIARPTVHRLLGQLVAVGAVRRDGTRYRLGASLLGLAAGGQVERRLRTVASRPVAELAARTGAGVTLTVGTGGMPVFVDVVDAHEPLRLAAELGSPIPSGTAQAQAHDGGLQQAYVDAGGLMKGISCVAVAIPLPDAGTAAITTLAHGSRPAPSLVMATRATAARIAGLLRVSTSNSSLSGLPVDRTTSAP